MYFPFMIDLTGKQVVVIGGGTVALRKCELFLDFGADITVVSPTLCSGFDFLEQPYGYVRDIFHEEYLSDAFAVVAASDDTAVNSAISAWCSAHRVPVNVVDVPELCTFYVPATIRRGDLTIGISTAGKSPTLAGQIRRNLSECYGEEYARRLRLLGELRELVKEMVDDPSVRRRLLMEAAGLSEDALALQVQEFLAPGGENVVQPCN